MTFCDSLDNIRNLVNSLDVSSVDQEKLLYWESFVRNLDLLIIEETWYEENE